MATTLTITSLQMLCGLIELVKEDNGVQIEKDGQAIDIDRLHYGDRITISDDNGADIVIKLMDGLSR